MATLIRATCSDCGDVELKTRDLVVRICEDDSSGTYVFRCPACAHPVVRPADRSTVDLLVSSGCRLEVWHLPSELVEARPEGDAFSYDDLIDFHELLADEDDLWFDGLRDAHRRRR